MDSIHPFAGNLAHELNVEVDEVVKSGTGLAFISYPTAIGKFEWMPQLFSVLFFLMLITLGLGRHQAEMRQVPLECDIKIAIIGLSWSRLRAKDRPFMVIFISHSRGTCLIAFNPSKIR